MAFHQEELADLTLQLNALFDAWDPIGVKGWVEEEYLGQTSARTR